MKFKVGETITVINPKTESGSVDIVCKVGRRYLWTQWVGRPEVGPLWRLDTTDKIILAGDRSDVVRRLGILKQKYNSLDEKRRQDRQEALWEFERQWDKDHPYPPYLVGDYIKQLREEAKL